MNDKFECILELVHTTAELDRQGISGRKIQAATQRQELQKIRYGTYIRSADYRLLKPWEIPLLHIAAYFKRFPQTVFSHMSAAQIFGLPVPATPEIHIYSGKNSKALLPGIKKHCLLKPDTETYTFASGIVVTSPLQTILDSVRWLPLGNALALADAALNMGLVDEPVLRKALDNSKGRNCRKMRFVGELMSGFAQSSGESWTRLRLFEMELEFEEQISVVIDGQQYYLDFALKGLPIAIEFDGHLKLTDYGASDQVLAQERRREKALQNAGWFVFRVGWNRVVNEPELFARELRRFIATVSSRRNPTFSANPYEIR